MADTISSASQRITDRIRELRQAQGLSLEALAERSGVSRSMISLIERGETSPTAVVLEKLAVGLGVVFASLFDAPTAIADSATGVVQRRAEQLEWHDPASGYLRRNLSPPGTDQPLQLIEIVFPPGERVIFEASAREAHIYQQIWMLEGEMEVGADGMLHRLRAGDCLARHQRPNTVYHNPGTQPARYIVALAIKGAAR
jgi:transcriptional regulator with XRE-family HTH domain